MPRSRPFLEYATGPRAAALLGITPEWWQQPNVISVRYEDLVRDTAGELAAIAKVIGPPRTTLVADAMAEAREIGMAIAPILDIMGYVCNPDPLLDSSGADHAWVGYVGKELADTLQKNSEIYQIQARKLADAEHELTRYLHLQGFSVRVAELIQSFRIQLPRLTS